MEIRVHYDSFLRYPSHLMLSGMAVLFHSLLYRVFMFLYFMPGYYTFYVEKNLSRYLTRRLFTAHMNLISAGMWV